MSVIAEISCETSQFLLGEALASAPMTRVELERCIPLESDLSPHFWAIGDDLDAFHAALESDESLSSAELVERTERKRLYRATWDIAGDHVVGALRDNDTALLEAVGDEDGWHLKLRFGDPNELSEFHSYSLGTPFEMSLDRLYNPFEERSRDKLTPAQRETVLMAYENGYFDIPRGITLVELGEQLGISDQSVSERLRRAQSNLVTAALERELSE